MDSGLGVEQYSEAALLPSTALSGFVGICSLSLLVLCGP